MRERGLPASCRHVPRRRRLLLMTKSELKDMAPAASMGLSRP